jgi:hypothetical protein
MGLAIVSSHREGDRNSTLGLLCDLAREIENPWDLPTGPGFLVVFGDRMLVIENTSVTAMLELVEENRLALDSSSEEAALLRSLGERYRDRQA